MPVLVPALGERYLREWLDAFDGMLFTGSPSNVEPHRYRGPTSDPGTCTTRSATRRRCPMIDGAVDAGLPILGICRGFQEINVALGGSLCQKLQDMPGNLDHREDTTPPLEAQYAPAHEIELVEGGLLHEIAGSRRIKVNSLHSQGVERLAPRLVRRGEGGGRRDRGVSASPARQTFALAVQWHPGMEGDGKPVLTRAVRGFRPGRARTREQAVADERRSSSS